MKIFFKIKSLMLLLILSIFLFACNTTDQLISRQSLENKVLSEINKNGVSPDKLAGWCPYNCHDIRCEAYQYGYCGPDSIPLPPDTIAVITNPNNPEDYAGADHNNALNAILPYLDPSTPNLDSVIEAQVKDYAVAEWGANADSIQNAYNILQQEWNVPPLQLPELDSLGNDLYAQGKISSEENNYIQQIYTIAKEWLDEDSLTQSEYTDFASNLISLESQIKDDKNLTINESSSLLSACSIARYSSDYWGNYINEQSSSPSINPSSVHPEFFLRLLAKVLTYTLVDVGGAVDASAYSPPVTPGTAAICIGVGAVTSIMYACGDD